VVSGSFGVNQGAWDNDPFNGPQTGTITPADCRSVSAMQAVSGCVAVGASHPVNLRGAVRHDHEFSVWPPVTGARCGDLKCPLPRKLDALGWQRGSDRARTTVGVDRSRDVRDCQRVAHTHGCCMSQLATAAFCVDRGCQAPSCACDWLGEVLVKVPEGFAAREETLIVRTGVLQRLDQTAFDLVADIESLPRFVDRGALSGHADDGAGDSGVHCWIVKLAQRSRRSRISSPERRRHGTGRSWDEGIANVDDA
jgi:hypothetical protein